MCAGCLLCMKTMKKIMFGWCLLCAIGMKAQGVLINYDLDTAVYQIAKPLKVWTAFLKTKDDSVGAHYWNREEVKAYGSKSYFLLRHELDFGMDNFLQLLGYATVKVLKVKKNGDYYKITSLMEFKPEADKANVQYIFHVYLKEEDGQLKLYNAQAINNRLYMAKQAIGPIVYHYPKAHTFDQVLATKQSTFITAFSANVGVTPDTMHYYFADSSEDLQKIKGLDFFIGNNGEEYPSGRADAKNQTVYSFGMGEYYPHELIHLVLHKKYQHMHSWFDEGVATCFGMSRGKSLDWHLQKTKAYLDAHPEVNLNNLLDYTSIDAITDYRYVLGGFLINYAYERGGYALVIKLLESGSSDEQFYQALKNHMGLDRQKLNTFIRTELKKRYSLKQ